MEPLFELQKQGTGLLVMAEGGEGLGGRMTCQFGKTLAPVAEDEAFEGSLLVAIEIALRGFAEERAEPFREGGRHFGGGGLGGLSASPEDQNDEDENPEDSQDPEGKLVASQLLGRVGGELGRWGETGRQFGGDGERNRGKLWGVGRIDRFEEGGQVVVAGLQPVDFEVVALAVLRGFDLEEADDKRRFAVGPGLGPGLSARDVDVSKSERHSDPDGGGFGRIRGGECWEEEREEEQE